MLMLTLWKSNLLSLFSGFLFLFLPPSPKKNAMTRPFVLFLIVTGLLSTERWLGGFVQKISISSQSWSPTVFTFMNPYKEP